MAVPDDDATEVLPISVAAPPAAGTLIGRTLGKLTVVERLGQGGSGEVFRAEQPQLGRSAVIKVLRREIAAAPNRIDRFLREAKLASRLDHPYAAHVYAFGAETDGLLWIAMEHVRGVTLDEMVAQRGPIPPPVFGPLFARLCEVVHTAHELGIVHRDIKGGNVMVIERAGQLLPKLLDFGIAKGLDGATAPGVADDEGLTGHGATLGSPHYMAPEQWHSAADVDGRADVYALGVLAYRCVTGSLPFQGIARAGLPDAHLTLPPPPLPDHVPAAIAEVIGRALAKQRDARWPSALALGEAMRGATLIGGASAPEAVPILDPATREAWVRRGPQPIADAVARVARATTTVEADAALRELIAIVCRWFAVLGLAPLGDAAHPEVRDRARAVVGRDDAGPWLRLARVAACTAPVLPGLDAALDGTHVLEALADRLDDRDRTRTAAGLAFDIAALAEALQPLAAMLAYQLVVGRAGGAESWQGTRRRDRERVVVWGDPLPDGVVALLDEAGRVMTRLSPLVQVISPLPSAEPELFLLWRSGRGAARLVAAPWGFERDDDAAAQHLAALTTDDTDTLADAAGDRSPYPGLAAYGVADAGRFVGREREVEALANRLVRAPMIAVLGPSGAGKSSFIHAGVLPRLAEHYEVITMRPGRHPLHALASLPPIGGDTEDHQALAARLRALGERAPRGLVVVIDQLEELVTLCADPDERRRFADTLARAADGPSAPVRVVVTLRDDFATTIESEDGFRGRFEVFVLATPPPEALHRIVTEPARRAQVAVDPRVVDDMVAEVAGRPASLPLLSFTASQLWERRDRAARRITHDAYVALGGVAGALSTYADHLYGSLARRDQDVVRDLFARLVAGDGTRIPAPRAELEQLPGATKVLDHLIDARLLVVREDEGTDIVEIVHECLAERWPRLARWRSEDAADRALLGDVRAAARRWQDAHRRPDLLWRGEALAELRRLAARSGALTDAERELLAASEGAERRARRLRRILVGGSMIALASVAIVMAYLGIAANHSRGAAERSATRARDAAALAEDRLTASLIAQGRRELNDNRAIASLAYFGEAMRRGADSPGLRFMVAFATRAWRDEKLIVRGQALTAIAVTSTGFVAGDMHGRIHWWSSDGRPAGELATELGDIVAIKQRGDRMLAAGRLGLALIDPATHQITRRFPLATPPYAAHLGPGPDEVVAIVADAVRVFGGDGALRRSAALDLTQSDTEPVFGTDSQLVFAAIGKAVQALDLRTMKARVIAPEIVSGPHGSADGGTILYIDDRRAVHVLAGDGTPVRTLSPPNRSVHAVASATGDRIGCVGDHALVIYDDAGEKLRTITLDNDEVMLRIAGDDVWTGSTNGVIRHYQGDTLVASLPSHLGEIEDLRLAGDLVLTLGNDSTLVALRAGARQLITDPDPCPVVSYAIAGPATGLICEDGRQVIYVGRRKIGTLDDKQLVWGTIDPGSRRAAAVGKRVSVFEPDGTLVAATEDHVGVAAFEDPDHLLIADGRTLWRWTPSTGRWDRAGALDAKATSIVMTPGGAWVGLEDQVVVVFQGGQQLRRIDLGARVDTVTASGDRRWVAAQLTSGGTVILDAMTGEIARRFEPADSVGIAASLDRAGDLVIRTSRGTMTVWDRASGDNLLFNFELLRDLGAASFGDDGRIELVARHIGVIDIARETRPLAAIIDDIACRVPLVVAGSRLEATPVVCKGSR